MSKSGRGGGRYQDLTSLETKLFETPYKDREPTDSREY